MKMTHIAAACAVALAGAATPAFALTAFQTPDLTVYLSGATAPDNFLETTATNMYVGTKGTDWFKYIDNGDGKQQRAFFGTMKSTVDIPAALQGKKVLFIKRSTGGSVFGVNPVARAQALATLKVSAATCAASGVDFKCAVQGTDPGLVGYPAGGEQVPDFGVSDVAPNLFKGPFNVEFGQSQLDTSEVANLTVTGVNVLAMGLPVTNVIPMSTHISRATYGALLSGNITTWSTLGIAAPAAGDQVVACRRVPGSGTQTSYNWFFNNFPCTVDSVAGSGATQPARMSDSLGYQTAGSGTSTDPYVIDVTAGYTVIENSTSGNVRDCLDKAAAGGVHKFKDEEGKSYQVDFGTGGYGAVGTLSVDSLNNDRTNADDTKWARGPTNAANGYSFRALDGAAAMYDTNAVASLAVGTTGTTGILPTKANLIDGNYEFASELTMQYRNDLSGLKKAFADFFIARSGAPEFNGSTWVAALPPTYTPGTTGFDVNVAKGTRFGNMCAPLQRTY